MMRISELKSRAKDAMRDNRGIAIPISLIYVAISAVAGNIPYASRVLPVFSASRFKIRDFSDVGVR